MTNYQERASVLLAKFKSENSPSENQKLIQACRDLLKSISADQKFVGEIRKQITDKTMEQRKASPKGKPDEGSIKTVNLKSYIFLDAKWQPYESQET
jgi:hypothetical protein